MTHLTPEQIDEIERRILEAERKYDAARKSAGGFLDVQNIDGKAQVPILSDRQVYATVNETIEAAYEAFAQTPVANPLDIRALCAMARKAEKMREALNATIAVLHSAIEAFAERDADDEIRAADEQPADVVTLLIAEHDARSALED